jgi:hypothetical protein
MTPWSRSVTSKSVDSDSDDDISLSSSMHTRSTTGTGVVNRSSSIPQYVDPKVAEKEQRFVSISKWGMILCLLIVAAAFCTATYLLLEEEEQQDFAVQVRRRSSGKVEAGFVLKRRRH